jgi:hypothetical protein
MKSLKILAALATATLLVACNQASAPAPAPAPEAPAAAPAAPAEPAPPPAEAAPPPRRAGTCACSRSVSQLELPDMRHPGRHHSAGVFFVGWR